MPAGMGGAPQIQHADGKYGSFNTFLGAKQCEAKPFLQAYPDLRNLPLAYLFFGP